MTIKICYRECFCILHRTSRIRTHFDNRDYSMLHDVFSLHFFTALSGYYFLNIAFPCLCLCRPTSHHLFHSDLFLTPAVRQHQSRRLLSARQAQGLDTSTHLLVAFQGSFAEPNTGRWLQGMWCQEQASVPLYSDLCVGCSLVMRINVLHRTST